MQASSRFALAEELLVEQLAEDDHDRAHHFEPDRDVEQRNRPAGQQAAWRSVRQEALEKGAGKNDATEPDQGEAPGPDALRQLRRRERRHPASPPLEIGT